jgi:hypothetical protein
MATAATIDLGSLLETVVGSVVAGVGITFAFSLAVLGFTRAPDVRRQGRQVAAAMWTALGGMALAVAALGVIVGLAIVADGPLA